MVLRDFPFPRKTIAVMGVSNLPSDKLFLFISTRKKRE